MLGETISSQTRCTPLDAGNAAGYVGSAFREERRATNRSRAYTVTSDTHSTRVDTVFAFEPIPEGTKVCIEFGLDPQSFSARLLSPFGWAMSGKIRDLIAHDVLDIKQLAEAKSHD